MTAPWAIPTPSTVTTPPKDPPKFASQLVHVHLKAGRPVWPVKSKNGVMWCSPKVILEVDYDAFTFFDVPLQRKFSKFIDGNTAGNRQFVIGLFPEPIRDEDDQAGVLTIGFVFDIPRASAVVKTTEAKISIP